MYSLVWDSLPALFEQLRSKAKASALKSLPCCANQCVTPTPVLSQLTPSRAISSRSNNTLCSSRIKTTTIRNKTTAKHASKPFSSVIASSETPKTTCGLVYIGARRPTRTRTDASCRLRCRHPCATQANLCKPARTCARLCARLCARFPEPALPRTSSSRRRANVLPQVRARRPLRPDFRAFCFPNARLSSRPRHLPRVSPNRIIRGRDLGERY